MNPNKRTVQPPTDKSVYSYTYHLLQGLKQDSSYALDQSKQELERYYKATMHWKFVEKDEKKKDVAIRLVKYIKGLLYSQDRGGQKEKNKLAQDLKLEILQIEDMSEIVFPSWFKQSQNNNAPPTKKTLYQRTKDIFYSLVKKQQSQQVSQEYHGISVHPHSQ